MKQTFSIASYKEQSYDKKVAVVIPIYNVEKYLRECLESVVNQSYKNLEILLVNDGSTDENSFKIAKEYTLKDKRITLFDKENGGLSSARNVGIEYLSGDYELEFEREEQDFFIFKITNENPLKICNVYKSKAYFENQEKELEIPKADYLEFVDSDDFIELDCVEECVKRMQGVEIVWFDFEAFYDGEIREEGFRSEMEVFGYDKEGTITQAKWLEDLTTRFMFFWWSWQGMISLAFLKEIKLKFINGIIHEDHHFGILLFVQSLKIYLYPRKVYQYRIRKQSITNPSQSIPPKTSYLYPLFEALDSNLDYLQKYHKASSLFLTLLEISLFCEKFPYLKEKFEKNVFLHHYVQSLPLRDFTQDPLNLKTKLENFSYLTSYVGERPLGAVYRVKNQLSHKLGNTLLQAKSPLKILKLPFRLIGLTLEHRFKQKVLYILYEANPALKPNALENYRDYEEALKVKEYLSYKLGEALLRNPFTFIFKINRIYKNYKKHKGAK